ncbi:hypothetical protein SKAU_G00013240 [Synaphobranchus kaupii]|uniref:Uncharacterized protein n=1 Tax=Synaphobranchus kaupii TaxID=118154 RepID=A0A9Q1JBF7_SYNKA|nr:hypothetical protein SKAU_G00013240 [Synaphobranchus kaupii]
MFKAARVLEEARVSPVPSTPRVLTALLNLPTTPLVPSRSRYCFEKDSVKRRLQQLERAREGADCANIPPFSEIADADDDLLTVPKRKDKDSLHWCASIPWRPVRARPVPGALSPERAPVCPPNQECILCRSVGMTPGGEGVAWRSVGCGRNVLTEPFEMHESTRGELSSLRPVGL